MAHLRDGTLLSMPHPGEKCLTEFELFFQSLAEPGPGVLPVPVGHRPGEPQRLARLLDGKPAEQVELCHLCGGGIFLTEPVNSSSSDRTRSESSASEPT